MTFSNSLNSFVKIIPRKRQSSLMKPYRTIENVIIIVISKVDTEGNKKPIIIQLNYNKKQTKYSSCEPIILSLYLK